MNFGKLIGALAKQDNVIGRAANRAGLEMDMRNYRKLVENGNIDEVDRLYPRVVNKGNAGDLESRFETIKNQLDTAILKAKETGDYSEFNSIMKEYMYLDKIRGNKTISDDVPF